MKRWHVVSDRHPANGMFVAARLMAAHEEESRVVTCSEFFSETFPVEAECEVWVHGCWRPCYWKACWKVLKAKSEMHRTASSSCDLMPRLVRMTHANLDPMRYRFHGWKKRLAAPIERWLFGKCDCVAVTCEAERTWCEDWGVKGSFEVIDLKRYFDLEKKVGAESGWTKDENRPLHVLYIGRQHPLKGTQYLERAVEELNHHCPHPSIDLLRKLGFASGDVPPAFSTSSLVELREVSDHFDAALEADWKWCDVLCLPTLSENFGLVVAEALQRGKRVITTDGAPAWDPEEEERGGRGGGRGRGGSGGGGRGGGQWQKSLVYLRGYRDGTDNVRICLLRQALVQILGQTRD